MDKMRLWVQAYPCLFFMPKELKHENKIKALLEHQLIDLKTYNTDPSAPSHDLNGLRSI